MKSIKIEPSWRFIDHSGQHLTPQLFDLLRALNQYGKLTDATEALCISYRHGWNLIQQWTNFFGTPLVEMQKGKGAKLTLLGEKLLWAEARVQARLGPQLENLASELNLEIHKTLNLKQPIVNIYASHGYAVALLPELIDTLQINLQYMPASQAIEAVATDQCDLAGFHLPRNLIKHELYEAHQKRMSQANLMVIRYITRQQGFMVKKDNPKNIKTVKDLTRNDIRFVNRQRESGTSALFDAWLSQAKINPNHINGFNTREFTHSAVAAYVASGIADVGLGVEPPARKFNLDFIPLGYEHYLFVCQKEQLSSPRIKRFISQLKQPELQSAIEQLPGYQLDDPGETLTPFELFSSLYD